MAAHTFKERGNECYRTERYPDALGYYSLAINRTTESDDTRGDISVLYSNRAQVYLKMDDYRNALRDAETAIELCPTNLKACYRAATASLEVGLLDKSKLLCDKGLKLSKNDKDLQELAQKIAELKIQKQEKIWYNLPVELVMHIASRIHFAEDYVRFSLVCKPWKAACFNNKSPCSLLPWVLLPDEEETDHRTFYCPFSKRYHDIYLPELHGRRCWGSSSSWLVTLDDNFQIHLLDTFSHTRILLPTLHDTPDFPHKDTILGLTFRDEYVYKIILFSDPLSDDCMVLANFAFGHLSFTRPGDERWGLMHFDDTYAQLDDAMYFQQQLYIVMSNGDVLIGDSSGNIVQQSSLPEVEAHEREGDEDKMAHYILQIDGQVYVIVRHMHKPNEFPHFRTSSFQIYKLNMANKNDWEEVNTLGDWSVFVGLSTTFAICGSEYPEIETDCVYFTDDMYFLSSLPLNPEAMDPLAYDMGIYSFHTEIRRPLLPLAFSRIMYYCLPVWIKPTLG